MFRSAVLVFLLAFFPVVSHANFYDGNKLQKYSEAYSRALSKNSSEMDQTYGGHFLGYVIGVVDVTSELGFYCLKGSEEGKQLVAIVHKYLNNNPEQWGDPADAIVARSLRAAFPCAKK